MPNVSNLNNNCFHDIEHVSTQSNADRIHFLVLSNPVGAIHTATRPGPTLGDTSCSWVPTYPPVSWHSSVFKMMGLRNVMTLIPCWEEVPIFILTVGRILVTPFWVTEALPVKGFAEIVGPFFFKISSISFLVIILILTSSCNTKVHSFLYVQMSLVKSDNF